MTYTVADLKRELALIPDGTPVYYEDPNYGQRYPYKDVGSDSLVYYVAEKELRIKFPCVEELSE